jgi:peptidoglycan/xylan/chitin deacetylase (PgdA/CDA1 family)
VCKRRHNRCGRKTNTNKIVASGKAILTAILALSLVILLFPAEEVLAGESTSEVLILYDSALREDNSSFSLVVALSEYLGHFPVTVVARSTEEWKPGSLSGYDAVIYVGNRPKKLPPPLIEELASLPRVIWMENNIEQFAAFRNWDGFTFYGKELQFVRLYCRGEEAVIAGSLPVIIVDPGNKGRIIAEVGNLKYRRPLAWQRENLFYLGRLDFTMPFSLVLGEFLHEALGINHSPGHRALLRIEDVSPSTNPDNLDSLIDVMVQYHVPYAVAVIPFDQGVFGQARLSNARDLLKVLRRVPETGGAIIMHGCCHSNEYSSKTGEGFEFWNTEKDAPMEGEPDFTKERINRGLSEFARTGVYPVAFEAPHYAMSRAAYGELARHFSTYVGQIQISDETYRATLDPPFIIKSHLLKGMTVFPETLGYVNPEDPLSLDRIMERARMLKILRDADTCVFYHGFLPPEGLKEIIEGLKAQGYEFISLLDNDFWVQGQDLKVWGTAGKIYVETSVKPVDIEEAEPRYRGPKALIAGVVGLVVVIGVVLLSFVVIIWKLRARRRYLYEER